MLLITAFEPFDIDPENSSGLVMAELATQYNRENVNKVTLPVSFARAAAELERAIVRHRPKAVLALGQADSRSVLTVEQVALNWLDARIADEDGAQPIDQKIEEAADTSLWSQLSARDLSLKAQAQGVDCEVSYTAGTYVCNFLFYKLLQLGLKYNFKGTFVHIPLLKEQKIGFGRESKRPAPHLTKAQATRAIEAIAQEIIFQVQHG